MLVVSAVRYLKISTNYKVNSGEKLQGKNYPLSPHSAPLLSFFCYVSLLRLLSSSIRVSISYKACNTDISV